MYIFVLGYDVDFGRKEAISLMLSTKYSEKVVGYAAVALMVHPTEVSPFAPLPFLPFPTAFLFP